MDRNGVCLLQEVKFEKKQSNRYLIKRLEVFEMKITR